MKKTLFLLLLISLALFVGCSSTVVEEDNDEAYEYIVSNIDDSTAIKSYLEDLKVHGDDINSAIKNGDTVLMLAAQYTTNIEVLKTIVSYYPDIYQENNKTDMDALDYLSRREGVDDLHKYLQDEGVKAGINKKVESTKKDIIKGLFSF